MACAAVLLLFVLYATSEATMALSHSCYSGTQPSASGSGVDVPDLSQAATSLQYCEMGNCTIMRIDTGEQLEIVRTTESLMIAVTTDGHTSETEIVFMLKNKVPCFVGEGKRSFPVLVIQQIAVSFGLALNSAYIIIVHLLFAELRNVFGKLLTAYNICLFLTQIFLVTSVILHSVVAVGSQVICQAILNISMLSIMTVESYATCILFHITYAMYNSYKCRSISDFPKNLLYYYNYFALSLLVIFAAIILGYDLYSGNGKQTVQSDGHCALYFQTAYQTVVIRDLQQSANKVVQITLFVIFLILYYKQRNIITPSSQATNGNNVSMKVSEQLIRIAIAMGANVGIARIVFLVALILAAPILNFIGALTLFAQQCVIMASFLCTNRMSRLWRERFCPPQDTAAGDSPL